MLGITSSGSFKNVFSFLSAVKEERFMKSLHRYGAMGVAALAANTPVDSGQTASSWTYNIQTGKKQASLNFINNNVNKGVNVAVILQFGHGTGSGGYVSGRDYINPAIQPVFDSMVENIWKEVTGL